MPKSKALKALDTCQLPGCGKARRLHAELEESGQLNHKFSVNGQLEMVERDRPAGRPRGNSQKSSGMVRMGVTGDPIVRFLLIQKGVFTVEELDEAERLLKATGALGSVPPGLGKVSDAAPDA